MERNNDKYVELIFNTFYVDDDDDDGDGDVHKAELQYWYS